MCLPAGRCSQGVVKMPQPKPANISGSDFRRGTALSYPALSPGWGVGGSPWAPLRVLPGAQPGTADTSCWGVGACAQGRGRGAASRPRADLSNSPLPPDLPQGCPRLWPWPLLHPAPPARPPPPPSTQTSGESRLGRRPSLTWSFHTEGGGPVRLGTRIQGDDKTCPSKLGQSPQSPADYSQCTPRTKAPSRSLEGH